MWNIFQCKSAREPGAENKSSHTMFHHIFEQLFSGSTMRGRQLGSNTGRGGQTRLRLAQAGQSGHQTYIGIFFIFRQFILILIYYRYTKHAPRSHFNFTIDIRDWTVMDSVRINLNYSGSIFVIWCPSRVPWVAPDVHWPVSQSAGPSHGPGPQRPWLRSVMQL